MTIKSWPAYEAALRDSMISDEFDVDMLRQSKPFQDVLSNGNVPLWSAMAQQHRYPLVAVAGFLAIQSSRPELAKRTALHAIERWTASLLIAGPMIQELQTEPWTAEERSQLAEFLQVPRADLDNRGAEIVFQTIPLGELRRYAGQEELNVVDPYNLAQLTDRLYGESGVDSENLDTRLRAALPMLKRIPGVPRLTYLLYADDGDLNNVLRTYLMFDDINAISVALLRRRFNEKVDRIVTEFGTQMNPERLKLLETDK